MDAINIFDRAYNVGWWMCNFGQHAYGLLATIFPYTRGCLPLKYFFLVKLVYVSSMVLLILEGIAIGLFIVNKVYIWAQYIAVGAWSCLLVYISFILSSV
jgi:hypothetical protein